MCQILMYEGYTSLELTVPTSTPQLIKGRVLSPEEEDEFKNCRTVYLTCKPPQGPKTPPYISYPKALEMIKNALA